MHSNGEETQTINRAGLRMFSLEGIPPIYSVGYEVFMINVMIRKSSHSFVFPHSRKESERSGNVCIEAVLSSLKERLKVTTGDGFDNSQLRFRVGDVEPV
jgi:hypothetical protein